MHRVWPTHSSAFFFMALGFVLVGIAGLRRRAAPAIAAILMIVPPLVMPIGNLQDHRVLLWLPLGLASLMTYTPCPPGRPRSIRPSIAMVRILLSSPGRPAAVPGR
jgi:hypothetical protein